MSQRGSFVTEFMYCGKCFKNLEILLNSCFGPRSIVSLDGCVLAGTVFGSYSREELFYFDVEIRDKIEEKICHHIQIAVMAESAKGVILDFLPEWDISNLSAEDYDLYMKSDLDWDAYRIANNIKC